MEKMNEKQLKWIFNKFYGLMVEFSKMDEHTDTEYEEFTLRAKKIATDANSNKFAKDMVLACVNYFDRHYKGIKSERSNESCRIGGRNDRE